MILSEADGLWLFLVIRGGITCMGDSVPKHAGPISLTDTHPRTEHLQNATDHRRRESERWKPSSPEKLKLLADANVWGRNSLLSSISLR
jgi:hypothetical protein